MDVPEHLQRDGIIPQDLDDLLAPIGYTPMRLSTSGRRGQKKKLALKPFRADTDTGDVLWIPNERQDEFLAEVRQAM